jgi:hypothetical protein
MPRRERAFAMVATTFSRRAGLGLSTVAEFEIDKREPRDDNLTTIRRTLEEAGVEFIPAKGGRRGAVA